MYILIARSPKQDKIVLKKQKNESSKVKMELIHYEAIVFNFTFSISVVIMRCNSVDADNSKWFLPLKNDF